MINVDLAVRVSYINRSDLEIFEVARQNGHFGTEFVLTFYWFVHLR